MTREFVMLPEFDKRWSELGFTDNDLKILQEELSLNPNIGKIIQGTGGVRKLRFSFDNRGKSGSTRICYVDFAVYERIYLLTAYSKKDKDNLSKAEKNTLKTAVKALKDNLD